MSESPHDRPIAHPSSDGVENDYLGRQLLNVGDATYPERKLKPNQVPIFPEEVIKRHEPITLDVQKTYPS